MTANIELHQFSQLIAHLFGPPICLNPGRYVGVAEGKFVSDEDFKEQFETLNEELETLNAQARNLENHCKKCGRDSGDMTVGNAFRKRRICELCEVTSSKRIFASDYQEEGVPFYRGKEISEKHHGNMNVSTELFISRTKFDEIRSKFGAPKAGDLLLTSIGALLGLPYVVKQGEEFYFKDGNVTWFRNLNELDSQFLYYWILSPQGEGELQKSKIGSAQPAFTISLLKQMEIEVPPLCIQHRISGILSTYDDLIENNLRRIKILQEMAQTIYREWFVKFRFPGHKKIRRVDSTLGEIPGGWIVCKLGNFISVDKGVSYKGSGLTSDGNPMVNLKNILPNGGFRRDATKPYSGEYKKRHVVCPGDIVLANTDITQAGNVVGSPAIIPDINYGEDILISHHIYAVRIKDETMFPRYFVYHLLLSPEFKGFAKGYAIGTTVLGLAKEGILEYAFAKPPSEITQEFHNSVNPIYTAIENYHKRNDNLRETRDFLLPKLISGELDVSELDICIPEANA